MKKTLILMLILTTGLLAGCSTNNGNNSGENQSTTLSYQNKEEGFSMEIPSTWTFQENIYGANVMLFSPDNGDEIKENLGVSVQKLGSGDDLQTLYTNNKTTLQNNFENLAIKDEKDLTINEIPAKEISYTFSQGDYKIKQAQYLLINEKKAYIFTYVALTKTFDEYSEDVESIINSFLAK